MIRIEDRGRRREPQLAACPGRPRRGFHAGRPRHSARHDAEPEIAGRPACSRGPDQARCVLIGRSRPRRPGASAAGRPDLTGLAGKGGHPPAPCDSACLSGAACPGPDAGAGPALPIASGHAARKPLSRPAARSAWRAHASSSLVPAGWCQPADRHFPAISALRRYRPIAPTDPVENLACSSPPEFAAPTAPTTP